MRARFLAAVISLVAFVTTAHAQSTAFTYQGRLKNGTAAASGPHDMRFRLFDAPTSGAQVGSTQCTDNILVSEGLFTATIDFGQQYISSSPRFLEIEVRADTGLDCSNLAGFVVLAPRQLVTAAPLASNANHANAAFSLDAADGSPANAVFVDNSGRVGIGTTSPGHSVTIANDAPTIALQDTGLSSQQVGYISFRDGSNTEQAWAGYGTAGDPDFSIVNIRPGGDIVLSPFGGSGRVGIGTAAPGASLDVRGDVRLGASGEYQVPGGQERLRIVRGTVAANGVIVSGSGFTAARGAVGNYTITFSPAFATPPVVTATSEFEPSLVLAFTMTDAVTANSVTIKSFTPPTNAVDNQFQFIAIGPR